MELEFDYEADQGLEPDCAKRRCTDSFCIPVLLVLLGGAAYIFYYALTKGDMTEYSGLVEMHGLRCGENETVKEEPFLYLCWQQDSNYNTTYPLGFCVSNCSKAYELVGSQHGCQEYEARTINGEICMPEDPDIKARVEVIIFKDKVLGRIFALAAELPQSNKPLIVSAVVAAILPFVLMALLRTCISKVFRWGFAMTVVIPALLGIYLILTANFPSSGRRRWLNTGDPLLDLVHGCLALVVAAILGIVWCYNRRQLDIAIGSTEAACECLLDMPGMMSMMFIIMVGTIGLVFAWVFGVLNLLTLADPVHMQEDGKATDALVAENPYNGVTYQFWPWQWFFLLFFTFACIFLYNFAIALANFIIAFATEEWFFKNMSKSSNEHQGSFKATAAAFGYHMGSLTFGALLKTVFGIPCFLFQLIAAATTTPCVGDSIEDCCSCCMDFYNRFFRYIGDDAYMDMAMNSNAYWKSSKQTVATMETKSTGVVILTPSIWIIQVIFIAICGAVSAVVCFLFMYFDPRYRDRRSLMYVMDPFNHVAIAGGVGVLVAAPFVLALHRVAFTILFGFAIDNIRNPGLWGVIKTVSDSTTWLCAPETRDSESRIIGLDQFKAKTMVHSLLVLARA